MVMRQEQSLEFGNPQILLMMKTAISINYGTNMSMVPKRFFKKFYINLLFLFL